MAKVENKKYELLETHSIDDGFNKLFRIRALRSFGDVKEGQLGGYVESELNLSHEGDSWVYYWAKVKDNAKVIDNAKVRNSARVIHGAVISGNAVVYDEASVEFNAVVKDNAQVYGNARITGNSEISGNAKVYGNANICDSAVIKGPNVSVAGDVKVCGDCHIAAGTTATGDNTLTSYRDFVNFKNPYSYNEYTWVKNSNKIYRNDPGLFFFGASNPNETIEQFRESEKARSFNPELAEKAVKALDAFLEMIEKLSEIK